MNIDLTGARWVKSRHSGNGGNCVEIAPGYPGVVPVRDSKDPDGPKLIFTAEAFADFVDTIKAGGFDAV